MSRSGFNNHDGPEESAAKTGALNLSSQVKLGTRLTELQDSIRHIFDGQAQFRKELEHLKLDMVSKTVTKADFESQMLQKANPELLKSMINSRMAPVVVPRSNTNVYHGVGGQGLDRAINYIKFDPKSRENILSLVDPNMIDAIQSSMESDATSQQQHVLLGAIGAGSLASSAQSLWQGGHEEKSQM